MKKKEEKPKTKLHDTELPVAKDCHIYEKKKQGKLSYWDKRKLKKHADKAFLIKMLFSNGTCKEFVIVGKTETFTYKKRTYYLQYENSWFNITQNQYELTFFDDCSVPVNREIHKKGNKKFFSVTPENLKPLIKMEYVKALASSEELAKKVQVIMIFCFLFMFMFFINILVAWSTRGLVKKLIGVE